MFRRLLAAAAVAALTTLGFATSAAAQYPVPSPAPGGVSEGTIEVGEAVLFTGAGFAPGSTVTITVAGGDASIEPAAFTSSDAVFEFAAVQSDTVTADSDGSFAAEVELLDTGVYTLTATGVAPDGSPHSVEASVRVVADEVSRGGDRDDTRDDDGAAAGDELPRTGSSGISVQVWAGVGLLALGGALVALTVVRRRQDISA